MAALILSGMFLGLICQINCHNFGYNNRYTCNCLYNERCDTVTGGCYNGCLRGWGGPSCQRENIALGSNSVSQSGIYRSNRDKYGPQLVVDGDNGTDITKHNCSDTGVTQRPWWSIDLLQQYPIGYLKIFHRFDRRTYLKGFSVYIDDKLCFQHTDTSDPPAEYLIQCDNTITGSSVNISNFRPGGSGHYMVLCEVEIYFCSLGTYGSECNNFCYCSNHDECDVITGQCPNGCQIGWQGYSCNTKCNYGYYGDGCSKQCNDQCKYSRDCNHITGKCNGGCKPGYMGDDCSLECNYGYYGDGCSKQCNIQCKDSLDCNHITGKCNGGCKPGYRGDDCSLICWSGTYGDTCSKQCNNRQCTGSRDCNHITGKCNGGCKPGYREDDCSQKCSYGYYGDRCSNQCNDQCKDSLDCNHITGKCNGGCKPGYRGDDCSQICWIGTYYGDRCSKQCNTRQCTGSQDCNHITGKCNGGCKPGYREDDCTVECLRGFYGAGCKKRCNNRNCLKSSTCDPVTGECIGGCSVGYNPIVKDCTQACLYGTYGDECLEKCSERKCLVESSPCNHINGSCQGRCKDGYISIDCKQECPRGFYGAGCMKSCNDRNCLKSSTCDPVTGECIGGCSVGYNPTVKDCTQACLTGTYGDECLEKCSERKCLVERSPCNHINGSCEGRCKEGYFSIDCKKDCETGLYGAGCSKKCSDRKCNDNSQCNSKTGECVGGCQPGFQSINCILDCDEGFYGSNCSSNCSARFCQSEDQCNKIDGACDCLDGYQGTDCTIMKKAVGGTDNKSTTVAAVVSTFVILIIIVVIFVVWRKRRGSSEGESKTDNDDSLQDAYKLQSRSKSERGPIYENSDAIIKAVKNRSAEDETTPVDNDATDNTEYYNILPENSDFNLSELEEFVIKTSPNKRFETLYKALFDDFTSSYDVSHLPENRKKNRFKGYYPYDKTRVILKKLPGDPHSDYINANYINGYDGKKFIAAQGSTAVTINDFVRMIWDKKCEKVVMVTREFEGGKTKCIRYWPETGTETFGEIKLTLNKEKIRANYTKRYITMERDGTAHTFCHFHYISWPDHGVPGIQDMLDFQYTVNKCKPNSTKPVLVHCSAGVGRTGTYIAIDYCLKRYHDIGKVDVLECVKELRDQRKGLVQTESQLQFIHEAVIEGIKRGDTAMNKDKFDSTYSQSNDSSFKMGNSTLKQQFAYLKTLKHNEVAAEKKRQIISDKIHLYRYSSFTCENSILFEDLNKFPISDVWKAVHKAQIPVVVFILDSTFKDDVCPDVGSERKFDDCVVTATSENHINDELKTTCVTISFVQEGRPKQEINAITLNFDKSSAKKPRTLYQYVIDTLVQLDTKTINDYDPIALFSSDTYYARVFCMLLNILQRIRLDDEVEIFNVVRKIHSQIGLTIKSQEDYNTLHSVVSDFITSRSTYANLL